MSKSRFGAIESTLTRPRIDVSLPSGKISEYFASNVFTVDTMQEYLSKDTFISVMAAIEGGVKISRELADEVATALKSWAMSKGVTSYTHWFQPLTGATAEKHDTFFAPNFARTKGVEEFSGAALCQQEPDGSSFPSGGLRVTHRARGYTLWDPSSPAFIMEVGSNGKTLCIPTIFISYTGESLDYKTPLLKSLASLNKAGVEVCKYFDENITKVFASLGWEQEYFLVDAALYTARPDLMLAGRTLVGASSARGQQLDDHYFGSIAERVYAFMLDFEKEALKLGITISTRHNEVAPGQYECAPVFSDVNSAVDKNQLVMDVMDRVARRHDLRVLFHEKPYAGINGSGKHNNWSLGTNTGLNLLKPGKDPKNNLQFLTFFVNTIKALSNYNDLLRASIASAGNDHRLGANEAPPAIISAFLGSTLTQVLIDVENNDLAKDAPAEEVLNIVDSIPDAILDNTDRNRTSPFAFTGNKFELRAVGSSANCAGPMTVLNAMVAKQLTEFKKEVDALIEAGTVKETAILTVIQSYIKSSKDVLFEDDNYSQEWADEAEKRGLSNVKDSARALGFFDTPKAKEVLVDTGIVTAAELHARYEVWLEKYINQLDIEAKVLEEIMTNQIIPAAIEYQNSLIESVLGLKELGFDTTVFAGQSNLLAEVTSCINGLIAEVKLMASARETAEALPTASEIAISFNDNVKSLFEGIREKSDTLEMLIDDDLWPLPKYKELLFIR